MVLQKMGCTIQMWMILSLLTNTSDLETEQDPSDQGSDQVLLTF